MVIEHPVNTPEAWSARASLSDSWDAAGWSERGQAQRMLKALQMLRPRFGESLLDFGCGTGRLSDYAGPGIDYFGFDSSRGMVERAAVDHPMLTGRFSTSHPTGHFDHVACIGPFNLRDNWSEEQTWRTLDALWTLCGRRLVVSLYSGGDPKCISYQAAAVADRAESMSASWRLERHLPNDLILLLTR